MDRFDHFESENEFHGGELGLIGRWWGCRWALQASGKVALGGTRTATSIEGGTVHTVTYDDPEIKPNPNITSYPGGVLALPSNRGQYSRSEFAAVSELGIRLEYALNRQCRVTLGYTVIYWPSVARVTDSIDPVVDTSQIMVNPPEIPQGSAAATRPSFAFHDTEFWTQGLNAGSAHRFLTTNLESGDLSPLYFSAFLLLHGQTMGQAKTKEGKKAVTSHRTPNLLCEGLPTPPQGLEWRTCGRRFRRGQETSPSDSESRNIPATTPWLAAAGRRSVRGSSATRLSGGRRRR